MTVNTFELKRIAGEVVGGVASKVLMERIFVVLDEAPDPQTAVSKVEKIVALFLGPNHAKTLERSFRQALG